MWLFRCPELCRKPASGKSASQRRQLGRVAFVNGTRQLCIGGFMLDDLLLNEFLPG